ncbi:carbohydrate/pyrimidine kinase [Methylocaldum marinum]|uniref:Carbohydrate/pyrimidine kinase n=1 Tax=Methylocaldum marinum TaxID=1432792 RepID=A0A286P4B5_9GAMM|nr:PfkB family carbohydrate kinase [Methylocaldum marinum]BBA37489.1 carbohydrate/pyrimidine kinase [Methylocaldum marinum]
MATPLTEIALPLIGLAKQRGATVSCDLDEGPSPEMIPRLDWVFMNHTELRRWTGSNDLRKARKRLAPATVLIVTLGSRGAVAVGPAGDFTHPAFPASIIDRTGGGDAFDAGFLYGLARGAGPEACLRLGLLLASHVIARQGSRPGDVEPARLLGTDLRHS